MSPPRCHGIKNIAISWLGPGLAHNGGAAFYLHHHASSEHAGAGQTKAKWPPLFKFELHGNVPSGPPPPRENKLLDRPVQTYKSSSAPLPRQLRVHSCHSRYQNRRFAQLLHFLGNGDCERRDVLLGWHYRHLRARGVGFQVGILQRELALLDGMSVAALCSRG